MQPTVAPYGSWRSPITTDMLTGDALALHESWVDDAATYWLEGRPGEGGRTVVVRDDGSGTAADVVPAGFDVRSRVHEYGGGAYAVRGDLLVFANFVDRRVYRVDGVGSDAVTQPLPITPEGGFRYGDLRLVYPTGGSTPYLVCVREDHSTPGAEAVNTIVRLDLEGPNDDGGRVLASGADFVASPTVSPNGSRLAWLSWQHPNMPWDGTTLHVADLGPGGMPAGDDVLTGVVVAGGPEESISQPRWAPDGRLLFLSDRTGWSNLYAVRLDAADSSDGSGAASSGPSEAIALAPKEADFAPPSWALGMSSYAVIGDGQIVCSWTEEGFGALGILDPRSGELRRLDSTATVTASIQADGDRVVFVAQFADKPSGVVELRVPSAETRVLRWSTKAQVDPGVISLPEPVSWQNTSGQQVHGFYYPPTNADFVAPDDERPPLLVLSHGGPTGMSPPGFRPANQYWTSRGFALLDVNYGGSAGYGRDYRERLRGAWGLVDVDDCATGALAMADRGLVDKAKLAIRGGSAGGFTTLAALTFTDVFAAGASHFGVGDLEALAKETHKFESRYLDGLIGPYPEARDVYVERSPIHHVDRMSSPIILFQGADDKVVPPNQAETMADAVRRKGLPVAHIVFEGEGHGFRKASSQKRSLEAELGFYAEIFGFTPADDIEPVPIDNLP